MELRLDVTTQTGVAVVRCQGRVVFGQEVDELRLTVLSLLKETNRVVLHLGGIERLDSEGLAGLVRLFISARNRGGELKLAELSPNRGKSCGLAAWMRFSKPTTRKPKQSYRFKVSKAPLSEKRSQHRGRANDSYQLARLARRPVPGLGVIAFPSEDLVAVPPSDNLDFTEFSVPVLVMRVVAKAVLVLQLFRDFVQRGLQLVHASDFEHAASGGLGQLLEHFLSMLIVLIGMDDVAVIKAGVFARRIVDLEDISDHVVLQEYF